MSVFEVGGRWLGGVVRMGVVEAHDFHTALARFALHAHQFGGSDFVALLSVADSDVVTRHNSVYVPFAGNAFSDENAATFGWISLLGAMPEGFVIGSGDMKSQVICSCIKSWPGSRAYDAVSFGC